MFDSRQAVASFLMETGLANPQRTLANLCTPVDTKDNDETMSEEENDEHDLLEYIVDSRDH